MPRPALLAAALACALGGPAPARARPPPAGSEPVTGFVAVRAGAALPAGHARARVPMDDLVAAAVPVGLELAARGGSTELGLLVEYARGFPPVCPPRGACAASVVRAGIELLHRFSPGRGGSAWAGAGLGWEGTSVSLGDRTTRYDALELLNLQLGRDFAAGGLLVGPFVVATLAQGIEQDGKDIPQKRPHVWLQVGVRAALWP